jgi:Fe2+ or Zn2+ uptake regulation protein
MIEADTHHHVLCTECGRIEDIIAGAFGALAAQARAATDFEIEEHRLEFYGICPMCKATRERAAKTT